MHWSPRLFWLALLLGICTVSAQTQPTVYQVGVLDIRSASATRKQWQPTVDYLHYQVPDHDFRLVPLKWRQLREAVARGELDFVITNPAQYVEFEALYGMTRLATLKSQSNISGCDNYGAVIFTRAGRTELTSLRSLKGKSFAAADETAFGGWFMAWREFKAAGIDPHRDFSKLVFAGEHDAVVYAVRNGLADAGTVRSEQLERMAEEDLIDLEEFRVINEQAVTEQYPFLRSTRLYPEWPIAASKNTPEELARDVTLALLRMPRSHKAARAANKAGWTVPLNYAPVHECLKELGVSPYENYGQASLGDVLSRYRYAVLSAGVGVLVLLGTTLYVLRLNRRLNVTRKSLELELENRRKAEAQLIQAEKMEIVGRLAAGVAHEVKNPLAVILMGIDYLSRSIQSAGEDIHTVLKTMRHSLGRADTIVRGLVDFSAPRELSPRCQDINAIIEQSLLLACHELEQHHVRVVREMEASLPGLELDDSKIEQVLVNVFINAVHAMPAGGVLTVRTRRYRRGEEGSANEPAGAGCFGAGDELVVVEVEDTGMGIAAEHLKKVFDPFFTTKSPGKGTGLGLTVARTIVHMHKGTLDVQNRAEGGVRVTMIFKAGPGQQAS